MTSENTRAIESPPGPGQSPLRSKLFWVALLYFSEGFPLGLFFDLFPVYFRQQGVDLASIGLLSLLGLAWTVKFLWAPAIDYTRHHRYWMASVDVAMGLVMVVFAQSLGFGPWVWIAIGAFTLLSATNDIAIDGYTIEMLNKDELGLANGMRIAFYRVGMLSAGFILILTDHLGWAGAYVAAAILFVACAAVSLAAPRERVVNRSTEGSSASAELKHLLSQPRIALAVALFVLGLLWPVTSALDWGALADLKRAWWFKAGVPVMCFVLAAGLIALSARARPAENATPTEGPIFGALLDLLSRPGMLPVLLFILVFKLGDASMGFMVKPFWVDAGFTNQQIGLVSVNVGLLLSIAGGLVGGWYTDRVGIFRALWVLGLWQAFSNLGYAWAAAVVPLAPQGTEIALAHQWAMYAASATESFTGGLGTGAFLAFLMAIVNKERSTTEYAILSSVFAFSRSLAGGASGFGVEAMGYSGYFLLTFFLSFPAYCLLPWARQALIDGGAFSVRRKNANAG
jgi:MFS transporter, PAT family, beta-lactamase induction signal transducer AmpG